MKEFRNFDILVDLIVKPFNIINIAKRILKHFQDRYKVEKTESERALLGFLMAKLQKIDPDIIVVSSINKIHLNTF